MNTNIPSDDPRVIGKINLTGLTTFGVRQTDTQVYVHKTSREEQRERSVQGKKGITKTDKQKVENALFWLKNVFGIESIRWIVLNYSDEASNEAIENIAKNWVLLVKKLRHQLNKTYPELWVISIGLQKVASRTKGLPCYDINVAVIDRGEKVAESFVKTAYRAISKVANETIKPPLDLYSQQPYNTDENFRQFTNYFISQTDEATLNRLRKSHPNEYFPKSWAILSGTLKEASKPTRVELEANNLQWVENYINNNLKGLVKILSQYSNKQKIVGQIDLSKCSSEEIIQILKNL